MVGGKHSHYCARIAAQQDESRQADGGRGIAAHRLGQHLLDFDSGKLAANRRPQFGVGDDPKIRRRRQRQQPRDCLLDHGAVAIQRQHLLGPPLAAQRPKTRAPAAGEDHGIKIRRHGEGYLITTLCEARLPASFHHRLGMRDFILRQRHMNVIEIGLWPYGKLRSAGRNGDCFSRQKLCRLPIG